MCIVSLLELIVLTVSSILIIPQIILMKKQIKEQHEERRRENTTNFMLSWCNSVKKDTCIAEQVARQLNNDQCTCLYKHTGFKVSDSIKKEICKFCPLDKSLCEDCSLKGSNIVDGKILTELRWHVVTYLNTLETLMVSWHLGTVDRKVIEEQFAFMKDASKGSTLSQFRHAAGGYPLIEEFIDEIKEHSPKPKAEL